ncbi:hypothetical protein M404DRAFT_17629 [Pisolithus tinctorius Marx 270]|uniref:Uncharacterized protein n=1 Tax=Pisolithus tinctorius Marx 270 TaxID=870435 RepID=A0A0C3K044_PISTI|nr:hypothetical protein M404DRAFT_17629 [Pisolithus tinctorius Marx 270]
MSNLGPITVTDNDNEGWVIIDWTQVPDDDIRYDTDDEEEQAWWEEQARLEAERVAREQAEAERIAWEAEEQRAHEEEEKCRAEEEKETKWKHKAEADKGDEARGEVKKVVMDPSCTHCTQAQVVCEFLVDGNKKQVACVHCNLLKGKCRWLGDGKDTEAAPKATPKTDKGKKRKTNNEMPEPRPSKKKTKAINKLLEVLDIDEGKTGGSRPRGPSAAVFSGLEDKLERLINVTGLIANNLAGLFEAHEAMAENSGRIADTLKAMLDESYSFGMVVSPSDLGSSELDSDELCKEADWLKAHSEDEEEESGREDETMAE